MKFDETFLPPAPGQPRRAKYKAVPTMYRGVRYPSKMEASRAIVLDDMLEKREIDWWLRQVPVRLGEDTIYRIDFLVAMPTDAVLGCIKVHAEDTKGKTTREFNRIKKLWRKYG